MDELKAVLLAHSSRYPEMQPADAVKLIYQNEFGGGHLIRDEQTCLDYLRREYEAVPKDPAAPLYELIGNGILRVNLAAVAPADLQQLGRDFIRSAAEHRGSVEIFRQKLDVLRELTAEGTFSFGLQALEDYLTEYEQAGFPAVSHSREYRQRYAPAYRIICK